MHSVFSTLYPPTSPTGLFGQPSLISPSSFHNLVLATLIRAQSLTERIVRARQSRDELLKAVKNLDRLSDMLCSVIDLAELVRNAHPDPEWVSSANEAYEQLCEYMNVLNTNVGLYETLRDVLSDPSILRTLNREAHQTALTFWRDFEKSGINLPPEQRDRFVSLSSEILASSSRPPAAIKPSELHGLKDFGLGSRLQLQSRFTQRDLLIYPGSLQAQMIMRFAPGEEPRRKVYIAANSSSPEQIGVLEALLRTRGQLARLVGDKMAKSPENVQQFLDTLLDHSRLHAQQALHALSVRKQGHLNTDILPVIQAWDRDYYCPPEPPAPPIQLPPLTLGTVFNALSRLFQSLYGVTLRPIELSPGEVWHSDTDGLLGWIYVDLFARRNKSSGAAHYTVRCSRRTDDDDEVGDILPVENDRQLVELSREFEAGAMIGRTEYQNVSGTRCATDFVELPSILMEHFLTSPHVLALFGASATATDVHAVVNQNEDPCRSIDTYGQILLALLDQTYHSRAAMGPSFDSTAALAELHDRRGLVPYVAGTSWQTQFGHLFGYGATYYSYLFDRAIAARVWRQLFVHDPLNRETGERYKREVLRHGGGKDPWAMLGSLLGAPELMDGDERAMREVGRWRIEEEVALPGRH
ncbi:hypothetical protein B0F90DRAFT_1807434 [Multifurca ochricompacta]|uniref:mitochondrial intermediate peptidase n=1 Tax=Multifurca ochricompacta TaxID=376703 RepID=A0AAD4QU26_9AGAM|nr:hypothetical protein B0F90DRAFT_1807434 [Multifurca ochricompacta]